MRTRWNLEPTDEYFPAVIKARESIYLFMLQHCLEVNLYLDRLLKLLVRWQLQQP